MAEKESKKETKVEAPKAPEVTKGIREGKKPKFQ